MRWLPCVRLPPFACRSVREAGGGSEAPSGLERRTLLLAAGAGGRVSARKRNSAVGKPGPPYPTVSTAADGGGRHTLSL